MRRSLLVAAVVGALVCSSLVASPAGAASRASRLADVDVATDLSAAKLLTFDTPYRAARSSSRVVVAGSGEKVAKGMTVVFRHALADGRTGEVFESTFGGSAQSVTLAKKLTLVPIFDGLVGTTVGSRVVVAVSPQDSKPVYKALEATKSVKRDDTFLFLFEIVGVRRPLARATGASVAARSDLPKVTLAADGRPSLGALPGPVPAGLVAQPLIQGTGPAVTSGQTIAVHYTGWIWGGKQFDSSWERGKPVEFKIGVKAVIKGWDEGLVGVPIGSQVLLVIPPDKGYGASGNLDAGIAGTDTLVFVVDVLDAF